MANSTSFAVPAWLRDYRPAWLRADLLAGLTLAAYLLPAGIGDASLAGLPPESGLYACLFSGLVFWLFCSSRHTVITVTSGLSLLVGTSIGELAAGDAARHAALAATVALMTGAIGFGAWIARAGSVAEFFSETVLVGFKTGLALYLATTQLPKMLGFAGSHGDFFERLAHIARHLGDTDGPSLLVGVAALAVLVAGRLWFTGRPVAFLVVVAGIAAARALGLDAYGVTLLGTVPQGLPPLALPAVSRADLTELLPVAMACFVLAAVETTAIGRMFGQKHGNRLDTDREILAIATGNALSGLGGGFPVSGGMSQSVVNESAGARTPLSGAVAALCTLLVMLFATGLLRNLPQPVVAAIVLAAVMGLVDVHAFQRIWTFSRREFAVAAVAVAGVLVAGPANGVLLGAAISLVLLLRQASRPRVVELGRAPGAPDFEDRSRNPEAATVPEVLVMRCESAIVYFNVNHVRQRVLELIAARGEPIRLVVVFLGTVPHLDLAGVELLEELFDMLRGRGTDLRFAGAHGQVCDALRRTDFEAKHGAIAPGRSADAAIAAWRTFADTAPATPGFEGPAV
jgi:high affinity sulfate transporter 1